MVTVNGIEFEWLGDSYNIRGRGLVYTARLCNDHDLSTLKGLINQEVTLPSGELTTIKGVETFATFDQVAGRPIGLLVAK